MEEEPEDKPAYVKEIERRIETLSMCLEEKVAENGVLVERVAHLTNELANNRKERDGNGYQGMLAGSRDMQAMYNKERRDRERMEALVFEHENQIEVQKETIRKLERMLISRNLRLERERERRESLQDSVDMYEIKLKEMEDAGITSLEKEQQHRRGVENIVKYWKRKHDKLERKMMKLCAFVLSEGMEYEDDDASSEDDVPNMADWTPLGPPQIDMDVPTYDLE